jgi:hypothetical protein
MRNVNWGNVDEASESKMIEPGGYICQILRVEDVEKKEYLKIEFDIADGPDKDYFSDLASRLNFWTGNFIKSYKPKAESFFKSFLTAIERSNSNFKADNFSGNISDLEGKFIGLTIGHEKYLKQNGDTGTRIYVDQTRSIDEIKKGNFKAPPVKIADNLKNQPKDDQLSDFIPLPDDGDCPF